MRSARRWKRWPRRGRRNSLPQWQVITPAVAMVVSRSYPAWSRGIRSIPFLALIYCLLTGCSNPRVGESELQSANDTIPLVYPYDRCRELSVSDRPAYWIRYSHPERAARYRERSPYFVMEIFGRAIPIPDLTYRTVTFSAIQDRMNWVAIRAHDPDALVFIIPRTAESVLADGALDHAFATDPKELKCNPLNREKTQNAIIALELKAAVVEGLDLKDVFAMSWGLYLVGSSGNLIKDEAIIETSNNRRFSVSYTLDPALGRYGWVIDKPTGMVRETPDTFRELATCIDHGDSQCVRGLEGIEVREFGSDG